MGVRLLGRAMLGQTVVAPIIYGFVRTDKSNDLDQGFGLVRNYLARQFRTLVRSINMLR